MSISYGLNLGIMNGAADGDLYGDAMRAFQRACDAFLQPIVKGYLTNTPPGSPVDGDMYIVGAAPTGAWASYAGYVAKWSSLIAAWEFYLPKNGWQCQSNSTREIYRRTGGAWEVFYQEGTWTPSFTGLTVVAGGGSVTYTGSFVKAGKSICASARVSTTGGATTASGGTYNTYIGNLPFFSATDSAAVSATAIGGAITGFGNSLVGGSSNTAFVPAWSARADVVVITAVYQSA